MTAHQWVLDVLKDVSEYLDRNDLIDASELVRAAAFATAPLLDLQTRVFEGKRAVERVPSCGKKGILKTTN